MSTANGKLATFESLIHMRSSLKKVHNISPSIHKIEAAQISPRFEFEMSDKGVRLSLSANGLQRLGQVNHEKDFTFIVGSERYSCPSFVAEFLSPRVTSLRCQDITIDEFSIETADPGHQFANLLSIGFGRKISFSLDDMRFVRSVCGEFHNSELFEKTLTGQSGQMPNEELKAQLTFLPASGRIGDWEVSLVASQFYQFAVSDFDAVSPTVLEDILSDPALVLADEDSLFEVVHRRASEDLSYFGLLEYVRFEFLSDDCMQRAFEFISDSFESLTFSIWSSLQTRLTVSATATPPSPAGRFHLPVTDLGMFPVIESKIISTFPEFFSVFRGKRFKLLHQGSRDGFEAKAFHDRCDGHPNTVTLISSTNGYVFGGYTPLAWSSRAKAVPDHRLRSFIFTITNPPNLPPQIFKLKQAENAIYGGSFYGPRFGEGDNWNADLNICDRCRVVNRSYSMLGNAYTNETGISGNQVLTGSHNFTVEEIEIFQVM
jgi:hypothetical protein